MRKTIGLFLIALFAITIGANQGVKADTENSLNSKATISFDGTYIPPTSDDRIPDEKTPNNSKDNQRVLPSTGEKSKKNWSLLGLTAIVIGTILSIKTNKKKLYSKGK